MKSSMLRSLTLSLSAFLCLSQWAAAQFTETNIAWAKRATTNIYFPDDTTTNYRVKGFVTSPNFSTNLTVFYIQDTNDNVGIYVYSTAFLVDTNAFKVGMLVQVTDKITQTNGITAISPQFSTRLVVSDPAITPVAPVLHTITNLLASPESFESQFVIITNVTAGTNWPAWGSSMSVTITDETGALTMRIDRSTDIDGQPGPTNAFDVKGIFTQFDTSTNANSGYQIMPRYYSDVIQTVGQEPPSLVVPSNVTAIVNAPFVLDMLAQDRNAADALVIRATQSPPGSAFVDYSNREGRLTWTPGVGDQGTTNTVIFQVTDGFFTNTATTKITVRAASGGPGFAWINEFHYDNTGNDTGEGIELAGEAGLNLGSYYILLYDGGAGTVYGSNRLSGVIDDEGHGYGAVWFAYAFNGLQNGSADGIALVHDTNGLLQFLSYEGVLTPSVGPAAGIASVDVGVSEDPTPAIGQSLQLLGNGTNYEAFTWTGPMTATPGDLNGSGQIIIGPVNAKVLCTALALSPASPIPSNVFDIVCTITPNYSASNLVATAWYRINAGTWNSIGMSDTGGYTNKTTSQIPGQTNGTPMDYYVSTTFDGPNANSPAVTATNSAVISAYPPTITALTNKMVQVSNALQFAVNATEPDGDLITLTASNLPANANFYATNGASSSAGAFVFTPDASQVGIYTTAFYAADKDGVVFSNVVITVNPAGYLVNFEGPGETKAAYASGNVTLSGISWNMNESLIGNLASDRKNGLWSARCRNAGTNMTMLADKAGGCGTISLKYAHYGSDGASTGLVEFSTDGGTSWVQGGTEFVSTSTNLTDFSATVSQTGSVRMRIVRTSGGSGNRMNIDDILMSDYAGPGALQDGIPVSWWERYGLGPTNTANGNNDGDPDNNFEEYVGDTDPTNALSYFPYTVTNLAGYGVLQLLVGPPTTNSRIYDAFWNTNLVSDPWTPYGHNATGRADGAEFYLTVTNDAGMRFYRTGVKVP